RQVTARRLTLVCISSPRILQLREQRRGPAPAPPSGALCALTLWKTSARTRGRFPRLVASPFGRDLCKLGLVPPRYQSGPSISCVRSRLPRMTSPLHGAEQRAQSPSRLSLCHSATKRAHTVSLRTEGLTLWRGSSLSVRAPARP